VAKHFVDSYGFRSSHPAVYYLNPWEFLMHWEVLPLPRPSLATPTAEFPVPLSRWCDTDEKEYEPNPEAEPTSENMEPAVVLKAATTADDTSAIEYAIARQDEVSRTEG